MSLGDHYGNDLENVESVGLGESFEGEKNEEGEELLEFDLGDN